MKRSGEEKALVVGVGKGAICKGVFVSDSCVI